MDEKEYILSIINFINFLLKIKTKVFLAVLISAILTFGVLQFIPNSYTAKASFLSPPPDIIDQSTDSINVVAASGAQSASKMFGGGSLPSVLGGKGVDDIYIKLLKSRHINEHIIKKFDLMKVFKVKIIDDMLIRMGSGIVKVGSDFGFIEISVTTKDAKLSADIANEYVSFLSLFINKLNNISLESQKQFIVERMDKINAELENKNMNLLKFQEKTKTIDIQKQGEAMITKVASLQSSLIEAKSQKESLEVIYNPNSLKVKSVQKKIDVIKAELDKVTKKSLISKNISEAPSLNEYPELAQDYFRLLRDVKSKETIFELLIANLEMVRLKEAKEKVNIKQVDFAKAPEKKSGPPRTVILIVVAFLVALFVITKEYIKYRMEELKESNPDIYKEVSKIKSNLFST